MVVGKKKRLRALCLERPRGDVQDCRGLDWTASTLARDEVKRPRCMLLKISEKQSKVHETGFYRNFIS